MDAEGQVVVTVALSELAKLLDQNKVDFSWRALIQLCR